MTPPCSSPTSRTLDFRIWGPPAPALPSRGCDFMSHPLFLSYYHDGGNNIGNGLYTSEETGRRKQKKGGEWLWSRKPGTGIHPPSYPMPTLPAAAVITFETPPLHATPLPSKSTLTAVPKSLETARRPSWGFLGS
ncbi:hypothetical protein Moror_5490 [Moniliophthora roreri MCA 2997]|uniref:Uncharacterized protein n=1 Tax=Moniliophthora roreri (strain MCA 2997) TaxID=1381753 RepID=V2X702_MONRO|nr:hypothetical protein Moror_5490 [Moniliophthora roreri MCA 2997]